MGDTSKKDSGYSQVPKQHMEYLFRATQGHFHYQSHWTSHARKDIATYPEQSSIKNSLSMKTQNRINEEILYLQIYTKNQTS